MPKQNQPKEEKREKGTAQAVIREILSWVIPFVIALAVAMFLKNYIIIQTADTFLTLSYLYCNIYYIKLINERTLVK